MPTDKRLSDATLEPCPFCGGMKLDVVTEDIDHYIAHVRCLDCDDMLGPMSEYKYADPGDARADAICRWNKRAPTRAQAARESQVAKLLEAIERMYNLTVDYVVDDSKDAGAMLDVVRLAAELRQPGAPDA